MKHYILIIIFFAACGDRNSTNSSGIKTDTALDAYKKRIENPVTVYLKDTTLFTHIKYDFYKDSAGLLFWKYRNDESMDTFFVNYISQFRDQTTKAEIYFKDFIDIDSYRELDSCWYSVDKKHVFYFQPCACGGQFWIVNGADSKTFQCFKTNKDSVDARDYEYYYYEGSRRQRRTSGS